MSLRIFRYYQKQIFLHFKILHVFCTLQALCLQKDEGELSSYTSLLSKLFLIFTSALQGDATLQAFRMKIYEGNTHALFLKIKHAVLVEKYSV